MNSFRELASVPLWSAKLETTAPQPAVMDSIAKVSDRNRFTFFGYFILNEIATGATEYHFTRYPRRKYDVQTVEQCEEALQKLFESLLKKDSQVEANTEELFSPYQLRVLMGLLEGYEEGSHLHTAAEIQVKLGGEYQVHPAEIFTRGPNQSYTEPAAQITCETSSQSKIYWLADEFKQERFTVEDFSTNRAWVVETPHTLVPDTE